MARPIPAAPAVTTTRLPVMSTGRNEEGIALLTCTSYEHQTTQSLFRRNRNAAGVELRLKSQSLTRQCKVVERRKRVFLVDFRFAQIRQLTKNLPKAVQSRFRRQGDIR